MPFVAAFRHEQQEAFFEGHRRAFACWGGVPATVVYDNLATAVRKVLVGHTREEQDAFVSLRMHYCYEAIFCNPASGHEKGVCWLVWSSAPFLGARLAVWRGRKRG